MMNLHDRSVVMMNLHDRSVLMMLLLVFNDEKVHDIYDDELHSILL